MSQLAPGPLTQLLYDPAAQHWSIWHTHVMHLVELAVAWRVGWVLWALRRDGLRETRDPLSQQRRRRW